jgi:CheY-like chemotaxis protein
MTTDGEAGLSHTETLETILVVDDDELIRTMLSDFVQSSLGLSVLTAEGGPAALKLLETERVDLIFLDIIMPEMDGLEVLRRVKERWPALPVVILTGSASMENAIGALREGAEDYLRKPADVDELALCVTRVLSKTQSHFHGVMPRPTVGFERRQAPRIQMNVGAPAHLAIDISLIEISETGALVEHSEPVSPGEIYHLNLSLEDREVRVLARTIRGLGSRRVSLGTDGGQSVYRSGMEFVGVEREASRAIARYVDRLLRQDPAGGSA